MAAGHWLNVPPCFPLILRGVIIIIRMKDEKGVRRWCRREVAGMEVNHRGSERARENRGDDELIMRRTFMAY